MSKADLKAVKDIISMKIAEKTEALMLKEAPENIIDESTWERAKTEAKKQYGEPGADLPENKWYATVNHIYQNMGGKFKKKSAEKKTDDKHTCPCGTKLKKVDERYGTKPGWSKYECSDCSYSRDFRDGAPIYQARKINDGWYIYESGLPLFAMRANSVNEKFRNEFLSEQHGNKIVENVAKKGAYSAVAEWFQNGEGAEIFHPGLKFAAAGIDEAKYRNIVRDVLLGNNYKKSAAKTEVSSKWYGELKKLAKVLECAEKEEAGLEKLTPGYWVTQLLPGENGKEERGSKYSHYTPEWQKWVEENHPLSGFVDWVSGEKSKKAMLYLTPGYVKTAQVPMQSDVSTSELNIESPAEPGGDLGPDSAPPALVSEEVGEELMGEAEDHSNITDAVNDVLAAIVSNSDSLSIEDVVSELRETFSNDESVSEFRGKLEEKVEDANEAELSEELEEEEPPPNQQPGEEMMPEPMPQMAVLKKKAERWEEYAKQVWGSRESYKNRCETLSKDNKRMAEKNVSLEESNRELEEINRKLLVERSARIRAPRAIKLAEKCFEIGELGEVNDENQKQLVIKAKLKELMKLPENMFLEKEKTVSQIFSKIANQKKEAIVKEDSGSLLMPFLPVNSEKKTELVSWESMSTKVASNENTFYDWSRTPTRGRW